MHKLYIAVVIAVILAAIIVPVALAYGGCGPGWRKCNSWTCTIRVHYTGGLRRVFMGTRINTATASPVSGSWVTIPCR